MKLSDLARREKPGFFIPFFETLFYNYRLILKQPNTNNMEATLKPTVNETMASLWWNSVPKNKQKQMSYILYGIALMVDDKMIVEMYGIFGK